MAFLLLCFAGTLAVVYLSTLGQGLWEDGYFVKRFAYNFWHHGTFSWNVSDGPVYGMTSQTLQLLGAALYAIDPSHVVLGVKAALFASLFLALPVMLGALGGVPLAWGSRRDAAPSLAPNAVGLLPMAVGLASAPIVEVTLTGLETVMGLMVITTSLVCIVRARGSSRDAWIIAASVLAVYLTRPDAILIPLVTLGARSLFAFRNQGGGFSVPRIGPSALAHVAWTLLLIGAGLALLLGAFQLYYGTALPLPFYIKTHGFSQQPAEYISYFSPEKTGNVRLAAFLAFPFAYIALHARSSVVLSLLLSSLVFGGYHYFATIETMGYLSRFYLPGLIPVFVAAAIAYRQFQLRRRWVITALVYAAYVLTCIWLKGLDKAPPAFELFIPALVAAGIMLLGPRGYNPCNAVAIGLCLLVGAVRNFPIQGLTFEDDETILLRQITRRPVFNGLVKLRRIAPQVIYHTDMGAPGLLFPDARVVDLDGLLNEDITLRGARFEDLCRADRPEAVFVPNQGYRQLREEVLASPCLQGYSRVESMRHAPLHVRKDLVKRYLGRK